MRTSSRVRRPFLTAAATAATLAACNGILGNKEPTGIDDGGAPDGFVDSAPGDGAPRGETGIDGGPSDAPAERGAILDGGCEADVLGDPKNCGACRHDCLGGGCQAGMCQPVAVDVDASYPTLLAAAPPFLYWVDGSNAIIQCAYPPACSTVTRLALAAGTVSGLTAAPGAVYWTDDGAGGEVSTCNATGCTPSPANIATMQLGANAVSVQGPVVYWTLLSTTGGVGYDDQALGTRGAIPNRPVAGSIVTVGPWVAWAEQAGVFTCPFDTPCPAPAAAMTSAAFDVAIGGGSSSVLVWGETNGVHSCALPCDASKTMGVADGGTPRRVLADPAYVYWVDEPFPGGGTLYRCPIGGCGAGGPVLLVPSVGTITQDDTALYWTGGGGLMMLVK